MKAIAYYRVSTDKQGKSGLGLDAQKEAIRAFLAKDGWPPLLEFTEIESGKNNDRPQLKAAIEACKLRQATLVIAKLDRLSRKAAFILNLLEETGVDFVAVDNPNATKLTVSILAAVAEDEGERISQRTKAALKAAKERGTVLGGFKGRLPTQEEAVKGARANADRAREFSASIRAEIDRLGLKGSLRAIAEGLTNAGVVTGRGNVQWSANAVKRVLDRT